MNEFQGALKFVKIRNIFMAGQELSLSLVLSKAWNAKNLRLTWRREIRGYWDEAF